MYHNEKKLSKDEYDIFKEEDELVYYNRGATMK